MAGREFAIGKVARPGLLAIGWRWRYELLLSVVAPAAAYFLIHSIGLLGTLAALVALTALFALSASARQFVAACAWCVITPHRLRTGMAQAWIHSRDGKIPIILRTTRQPFGERVQLWCRAGTSPEDFAWGGHLIAAACWAREVRVLRSERYAHIVVLDVIRHRENEFAGSEPGQLASAETTQPNWPGSGDPEQPWPRQEPGDDGETWHAA